MNNSHHYELSSTILPGSVIIPLSATSLKYTSCEVKYFNGVFKGIRRAQINDILAIGTAAHKYVEIVNTPARDEGAALYAALKTLPPELEHIKSSIKDIAMLAPEFPHPITTLDGRCGKELEIVIPWRRYRNDGRVYHLVICLTLDLLARDSTTLQLFDFKTTRYANIDDAERAYERESQFYYYLWVLRNFAHQILPPELAKLARDYKLTATPWFIQFAKGKWAWKLGRSRDLPPQLEGLFEHQLNHAIDSFILPLWFNERAPSRTGWLANACAQCDYVDICFERDEEMYENLLATNYKYEFFGEHYTKLITAKSSNANS